jgi:DNA-binding transcriptional regulator YiaG
MNPKITKLRAEFDKNKSKIAELQAKNRELEKQIKELENIDIIGMVRERGLTMEQFAELLGGTAVPVQKEESYDEEV